MRILIAKDDSVSRHILTSNLANWGHEVVTSVNGLEAWRASQEEDASRLAKLDWMMPGMRGPRFAVGSENCRRLYLLTLFCLQHEREQKKSSRGCRQVLTTT